MPSPLSSLAGAAVLLALAAPAAAQDAPVPPFHTGQLAANIAVNGLTFGGVDVLKFTSPTRAWVLSASANAFTDHEGSSLDVTHSSSTGFTLSVQRRFLRASHTHVVLYLSPGIQGGLARTCTTDVTLGLSVCFKDWNAGVLLEAGGEYLFSTHLGVGARYRATLAYQRFDFGSGRVWSVNASLGDVGVFGAILF